MNFYLEIKTQYIFLFKFIGKKKGPYGFDTPLSFIETNFTLTLVYTIKIHFFGGF